MERDWGLTPCDRAEVPQEDAEATKEGTASVCSILKISKEESNQQVWIDPA